MSDPWSWKTVIETFLGTTAGATVGIGGIVWQTKWQSKEKYSSRLTEQMAGITQLIADQLAKTAKKRLPLLPGQAKETITSENMLIGLALVATAAFAKGDDLKVIWAMQEACFNKENCTLDIQTQMRITMAGTIAGWRTELKPVAYYLDQLKQFQPADAEDPPKAFP